MCVVWGNVFAAVLLTILKSIHVLTADRGAWKVFLSYSISVAFFFRSRSAADLFFFELDIFLNLNLGGIFNGIFS